MKRCPQCNRVEADDSLVFCRTDGASLVSDSLPVPSEAGLAHAYAVAGRKDEAQKMLDDLMRKSSENNYVSPYSVAVIYAGLGNKDKTFEWLERAYSERSYYLPVYLTTDARLDYLHSDPRFKELVRRIGLPELN